MQFQRIINVNVSVLFKIMQQKEKCSSFIVSIIGQWHDLRLSISVPTKEFLLRPWFLPTKQKKIEIIVNELYSLPSLVLRYKNSAFFSPFVSRIESYLYSQMPITCHLDFRLLRSKKLNGSDLEFCYSENFSQKRKSY